MINVISVDNYNILFPLLCGVIFFLLSLERVFYCLRTNIVNSLFVSKILLFISLFFFFISMFHIHIGAYVSFFKIVYIVSEIGIILFGLIHFIKYLDYRNFPKFICFKKLIKKR